MLNGKDRLVLGGWPLKVEVSWVLGISFYQFRLMLFEYNICAICVRNSSWHMPPLEQMETFIFRLKSPSMELSESAKFYLQQTFQVSVPSAWLSWSWGLLHRLLFHQRGHRWGGGWGDNQPPRFFVAGRKGHSWISPFETCKHVIWRGSGNLHNR